MGAPTVDSRRNEVMTPRHVGPSERDQTVPFPDRGFVRARRRVVQIKAIENDDLISRIMDALRALPKSPLLVKQVVAGGQPAGLSFLENVEKVRSCSPPQS